ncbi:MAG TPA: hypothetical protein VF062_27945, partial [Candidatus Limnocylindrales bacterium]
RAIRGDWILGRLKGASGQLVNVRWNLRTGVVTTDPELPTTGTGNALGWTVGLGDLVMRLPSGASVPLPGLDRQKEGDVRVLSDDGKTVAGTLLDRDAIADGTGAGADNIAVRWTCG